MSEQSSAPEQRQAPERASGAEHDGQESLGSWLRGQRKASGVDLETIAQSSKINVHYLELLEEDRFDLLPAPIFVRGSLREYARVVGLDADEVLNYYVSVGGDAVDRRSRERAGRRASTWSVGRTVAGLVGLVVVSTAIVWFASRNGDAVGGVDAIAPPVTEAAPLPAPAVSAPERALRVTIEFRGTSWVDVFVDGEQTVSELRIQGESLTVAADEDVRITLSRTDVTTIEVNGEPFEHRAGDGEEIVITVPEQRPAE